MTAAWDPRRRLATALRRAGHPVPVHHPDDPAGHGAAHGVILLTDWSLATTAAVSRRAWRAPGCRVPVRLDGGLALVGPVLRPGGACCLACAERDRLRVLGAREPALRLGGLLPPVALPALVALVADALAHPDRHDRTVTSLRTDHATLATHRVRPDWQGCPICAPLPDDAPERARVPLEPQPTAGPSVFRGSNGRTGRERLRETMYDWRHGPVAHVMRTERLPMAMVTAEVVGDGADEAAGYGRAAGFAEAERVALFEAAERHTGARPHRCRTVLTASFADLGRDRAVDPARLGLHDPAYHDHPAFRLAPYTPDTVTRWVYGWSLPDRRPVAVPEHVAYRDPPRGAAAARFLYDSSNGCGVGNSLPEAILYGLFEVAERDAFLMAWYARTPLRRVAVPGRDPLVPHLVDRLDAAGYDLQFFDATNDLEVPAVLALALHQDPGSTAPQAFFAAGAHPDPRSALRSAAAEVAIDVFSLPELVRERPGHLDRERLLPMLAEPERVRTLQDHVALHTLPEARDRYGFLLGGDPEPVEWRHLWPGQPVAVDDLSRLLAGITQRLAGLGMDVIAVNQTDPVLRDRLGLHSAKVIIPGTLPMTFGHVYHRTYGLPRLLDVPHRLGRFPARLRYQDLPLHPHPFP